jgi:chorismate mutase
MAHSNDIPVDPQKMLADLRVDIDRIDADMHRLLMERSQIIERLIAVKAKQGGGSAFRPVREAQMMAQIAARHKGLLPLDTVESIWRIIIATFTYVQAHYSVHVDVSAGDAAMRDSARFHFGFSVPFLPHHGPRGVIGAVLASDGDLGLVRASAGVSDGAWWTDLVGAQAPKIIARVPFVDRPDHPAGIPLYVISKPLAEAAARDVELFALRLPRWREQLPIALQAAGGQIVGHAAEGGGLAALIALPGPDGAARALAALAEAGLADTPIEPVGSHAAPYRPLAFAQTSAL